MTGSNDPKTYQKALGQLCEKLRDNAMPVEYRYCLEVEPEEGKGLHMHAFLLIESTYGNPCKIMHYAEDGWLKLKLDEHKLSFEIAPPENWMHRTAEGKRKNYAYVTQKGPKLDDALIRISYLYKRRSKDDSLPQTYGSSRRRPTKKEQA